MYIKKTMKTETEPVCLHIFFSALPPKPAWKSRLSWSDEFQLQSLHGKNRRPFRLHESTICDTWESHLKSYFMPPKFAGSATTSA